jgi:hypothetical protein
MFHQIEALPIQPSFRHGMSSHTAVIANEASLKYITSNDLLPKLKLTRPTVNREEAVGHQRATPAAWLLKMNTASSIHLNNLSEKRIDDSVDLRELPHQD